MVADWDDVTDDNNTNMTAYIAYRLAQDHVTVTRNEAIAELIKMAGIPPTTGASTSHGTPGIKTHGNYFHIL